MDKDDQDINVGGFNNDDDLSLSLNLDMKEESNKNKNEFDKAQVMLEQEELLKNMANMDQEMADYTGSDSEESERSENSSEKRFKRMNFLED